MIREPAQNKKLPLTQLTSGKKGYSRWSRDREWLACPTPVSTRARVHHSLSRTSSIATGDETTMHAPMCTVLMATCSDPKSPTHDYWSTLVVAACTCPFVREAAASLLLQQLQHSISVPCPGLGRPCLVGSPAGPVSDLAGGEEIVCVAGRTDGQPRRPQEGEARGQPPPGRLAEASLAS